MACQIVNADVSQLGDVLGNPSANEGNVPRGELTPQEDEHAFARIQGKGRNFAT